MEAAIRVLSKVNAPFAEHVDASTLALSITDANLAWRHAGPVLSFFSEVEPSLQHAFVAEMRLDPRAVRATAEWLSRKAGMPLALAA